MLFRSTPRELVQRIRDDMAAILQNPEVKKRFFEIGCDTSGESVEQFTTLVCTEIARWKDVAKAAGIKPL